MTDPAKACAFLHRCLESRQPSTEIAGVHYLRGTGAFHHIPRSSARRAQTALMRMVFDAADRAAVDAIHAQAMAHGLQASSRRARLKQPHGDYGFGYKDPEGRNIAVVCGVKDHADSADKPDRPRKISHINLNNSDPDAPSPASATCSASRSPTPPSKMRFLSCGSDHHSVVLGFGGGTDAQPHRV